MAHGALTLTVVLTHFVKEDCLLPNPWKDLISFCPARISGLSHILTKEFKLRLTGFFEYTSLLWGLRGVSSWG